MKKVCVFGANGRTGKILVNRLLTDRDYNVTAAVYKNAKGLPSGCKVVNCDIQKRDDVKLALKNVDVVISVVGHIKGSDAFFQTRGMEHIVSVMKEMDITRILSLTGTGVRVPGDTPSLFDKLLHILVMLVDKERIIDAVSHYEVLKNSNLNWTILRVLKLTNMHLTNTKRHLTEHGPSELFTSRAKVADIIVSLIEEPKYYKKLPVSS